MSDGVLIAVDERLGLLCSDLRREGSEEHKKPYCRRAYITSLTMHVLEPAVFA